MLSCYQRMWRICGLLLVFLLPSCQPPDRIVQKGPAPTPIPEAQETNCFGFLADSLRCDTMAIAPGATLSQLLSSAGVPARYLNQLGTTIAGHFHVRNIKAGAKAYLWYAHDSIPVCWIYQNGPREFVRLEFLGDTVHESLGELPEHKELRAVKVVVQSSLWNALAKADVPAQLALDIADIYAWTVDFFGLASGDTFEVLYDELRVANGPAAIGTIHAARYIHASDTICAYRYPQNHTYDYWDPQGNSLRKAFLKAPLRFSRISSHFSYARKHPILKIVRPHTGIDYAAPTGTPVVALGDGRVVQRNYTRGGGNTLKIKHNSVYTTGYMHLSRFAKGLAVGSRVKQGQLIGFVGSTGLATGPHLDFRVWKNGAPFNPLHLESPSVAPLHPDQLPDYYRWCTFVDEALRYHLAKAKAAPTSIAIH